MVKKKKKQKGGSNSKKQVKELKRKKLKKKNVTVKNRQKTQSLTRLKQNLKYIPQLLFEPEIQNIQPSKTIDEITNSSESELERMEFFYDDKLHQQFKDAIDEMVIRLEKGKNKINLMNSKAVMYMMNEGKTPACMNHLIIGKFYQHLDQDGSTYNLSLENVGEFIAAFEEKYENEIAKLHQDEHMLSPSDEQMAESLSESDELEIEDSKGDFENEIISEFYEYLENKVDEEVRSVYAENAETFFEDYIKSEKSLASYDQIKMRHFSFFYEYFFPENMNPTEEDIKLMAQSLGIFAEFLNIKDVLSQEEVGEIKKLSINS